MNKYLSVLILHINATAKRLALATVVFGIVSVGLFSIGTTTCPGWSFGEVFEKYHISWILIAYIAAVILILGFSISPEGNHPMFVTRRALISYRSFTLMTMLYDIIVMLFAVGFVVAVTLICLLIFSQFPEQLNTKVALLGDIYSSDFLELILPAGSIVGKSMLITMPLTIGAACAIVTARGIYEISRTTGMFVVVVYLGINVFISGANIATAIIFPVGFLFLLITVLGFFGGDKDDEPSENYEAPTI